jgi:DNA-binding transcriptional LysR family regulator
MNDRQLRYALTVWREESFSKAAEKLNVSQPSISDQVRRLEAELGFTLFNRTGRGVRATHNGLRFLQRASQVVDGLLDLSDIARTLRGGPPVSFAIGFSSSVARAVVPQAMAALTPLLAQVRIETITAPTRRVLRFVAEERLDAGIAIEANALPANVICERFGSVNIVLLVPPGHRFAGANGPVDLTDIADEPLIAHEPDIGYGQKIRAALADRGLRPNISAVADDAETIKLMVAAGAGISLLPGSCAEAETASGQLVAVPVRPLIEMAMILVRADRPDDGAAQTYHRALREGLLGARA